MLTFLCQEGCVPQPHTAAAGETDEKNWVDPKEMKIALNAESRVLYHFLIRRKETAHAVIGHSLLFPLSLCHGLQQN